MAGIEEEEDKTPALILKSPQSVQEYFEFKGSNRRGQVSGERTSQWFMTSLSASARTVIDTGMPADIGVHVTDLKKFFPISRGAGRSRSLSH